MSAGMDEPTKTSKYLAAGSPLTCFLPSCHKPFGGSAFHAADGHYYCSAECADAGRKVDLSRVEELKVHAKPPIQSPQQKISIGKR